MILNGFESKELDFKDPDIRRNLGNFRYSIFCEELRWKIGDEYSKLELDEYDEKAVHFGVLKDDLLVGYIRLILASKNQVMLDNIFQGLIPKEELDKIRNISVEVTRRAIHKDYRNTVIQLGFADITLNELLYKSVFKWSKNNGVNYLFTIAHRSVYLYQLRFLGIPWKIFKNQAVKFNNKDGLDKEMTIGGILDLNETYLLTKKKNINLVEWYDR